MRVIASFKIYKQLFFIPPSFRVSRFLWTLVAIVILIYSVGLELSSIGSIDQADDWLGQ